RLAGQPDTEHTEAQEEDRRNRIEFPSCVHAISPKKPIRGTLQACLVQFYHRWVRRTGHVTQMERPNAKILHRLGAISPAGNAQVDCSQPFPPPLNLNRARLKQRKLNPAFPTLSK